MTTQPSHNDQLLDLLYGECSPEEETQLRAEISRDEDLQREWKSLQADHQAVSASIPDPIPVPEELTARILQNASSASSASTSSRRAPNGTPPPRGLWHSVVSGKLRAPVMLAAILISSSVVIAYMFGTIYDDLFMEAQPEVSSIHIGGGGGGGGGVPSGGHSPLFQRSAPSRAAFDEVVEEEAEGAPAPARAPSAEPMIGSRQQEPIEPVQTPAPTPRTPSTESAQAAAPTPAPPPSRRERAVSPSTDSLDSIAPLGRGGGGTITREESLRRPASGAAAPAPEMAAPAPRPTRARSAPTLSGAGRSAPSPRPAPAPTNDLFADSFDDAIADAIVEESEPTPLAEPEADTPNEVEEALALLEEAREALDEGDRDEALRLLDEALATGHLSSQDRTRAEDLRRSLQNPDSSSPAEEPLPASEP